MDHFLLNVFKFNHKNIEMTSAYILLVSLFLMNILPLSWIIYEVHKYFFPLWQ